MTRFGALLLAGAALLSACDRSDDDAPAPETPRAEATLIGTWASGAPATFSGEGLRTRMSDGRTRYRPENRFDYSGRLTIFGPEIPPAGLSFRVTAVGDWRRAGNRLTEDFTEVRVVSENDDRELNRLAGQLAEEIRDQQPSESAILSLSARQLELRDSDSGRTSSYVRQAAR